MRKKRNLKKILFLILLLTITGVSYAYLSTTLNITGEVGGKTNGITIDKDSNPNLSIDQPVINMWQENNLYKYQYKFNIKNNGDENYDNYKIILTYNSNIIDVNTWNFEQEIIDKKVIISNKYVLNKKSSFEVNYIVSTNISNLKLLKVKLETETKTVEPTPGNFDVIFSKTNGWGNYVYQYNVTITNKTGKKISYWEIDLVLPSGTTYENGWNAVFENSNNLIIKCATYNGILENNQSTTFGLQLKTDTINYIPNSYTVKTR